ncbi:hypothetical protein FGI60_19685 [Brucella haematophila]|nr:hypothetical protein FGI60_19685 [Brucella haematophila]
MLIIVNASVSLSLSRAGYSSFSLIGLSALVEMENRPRLLPAALRSWVNFSLLFPLVIRMQPGVRIQKFFLICVYR